jgi:hypothetical protein
MNLNLSPDAVQAISELQQDSDVIDLLTNVEEFLHEIYGSEEEENAAAFMLNIKSLRYIRQLIEKMHS